MEPGGIAERAAVGVGGGRSARAGAAAVRRPAACATRTPPATPCSTPSCGSAASRPSGSAGGKGRGSSPSAGTTLSICLRKGGAMTPCNDAEPPDCEGREPDPAAAAEQADLARSINRLVDQLPLPQREAIALWSEGFSYHEVARVTGASEGNVRVMVHRALKTLRQQLKAVDVVRSKAV